LFIGEKGEVSGTLAQLPTWRNRLTGRHSGVQENVFARDCNQTETKDKPQNESSGDFPVRERTRGDEPKPSNAAQPHGAD
jgi:hypothetical protein